MPNIVDEDIFDMVQEQLAENRKIARTRERGAKYLLQGLVVCKRCRYAYYGSPVRNKRGEKVEHYAYYRCIGRDSYRFGGNKICDNKHIRTDALETAVWEEVKHLLKNPNRILEEYKRRLLELKKSSCDKKSDLLEKQENKLKRGIARLIDSYAQEYINQEEFEPRIKAMKQSLKTIEEEKKRIFDQKKLEQEVTLVVTNLEDFSSNITSNLDSADWLTKRGIIRTLVKRIEVDLEDVNVVFRVKELSNSPGHNGEEKKNLQHCWRSNYSSFDGIFFSYPIIPSHSGTIHLRTFLVKYWFSFQQIQQQAIPIFSYGC
ncbi:zinc ribbon domain-containing protein [Wolbachia endosymbiont of Rhagoletis cingulata]|uniref:zinc ribbon domain-containing protein n=1 Tax=Wolbachia endosymbiont of Rhagoletis cingulata TaxID=1220542 RepID=UPI003AF350F9